MTKHPDQEKKTRTWHFNRPLAYSVALHLGLLVLVSFHWTAAEPELKKISVPEHIVASVVDIKDLKAVQDKKLAEQKRLEKARKQAEEKQKKIREDKRKAEEARKQAEKKRIEEKKLALKRKQEEDKRKKEEAKQKELDRQNRERQEKERIAEEKRQKTEEEARRKEREEKERLAEDVRKEDERKKQEDALQKALAEAEAQQKAAEKAAEEKAALEVAEKRRKQEEADEVSRYMALIEQQVRQRWHKPLSAKSGMELWLTIRLLPTGEINSVELANSSGDHAFDRSALAAARSLRRYPVPEDNRIFEENFRQFKLKFKPE